MTNSDQPFNTIESAHGYLSILSDQIDEALQEVRGEISTSTDRNQERRAEAWQLAVYTLTKLSFHLATSRRLVNDLRTLRNLLYRTGAPESEKISALPGDGGRERSPEGDAGLTTYVQQLPGSDTGTLVPETAGDDRPGQ